MELLGRITKWTVSIGKMNEEQDRFMRLYRIKYVITTLLFLSVMTSGYTQEKEVVESELDSLALKMFKDVSERNYEGIMDMTHPKVFEFVSKDMMINAFKSMLEGNDEFSIALSDEIPDYNISAKFRDEENDTDFAFVDYDMKMSMTFKNESFDATMKDEIIKMMVLQGMEATFVSDNTISVVMPNRITILVNDATTDDKWAMINYDPDSPIFFKLLSAPVLEKAKSYHEDLMIEKKKKE